MSVQRRLNVGSLAMLGLFMVLLLIQFGFGAILRAEQDSETDRATRAEIANDHVLQEMTDAETGVRGYQLTGNEIFLEPYENSRAAAMTALDTVGRNSTTARVAALLGRQREAVHAWLDGYAVPIVAGRLPSTGADPTPVTTPTTTDDEHATQGKHLFDQLRTVNAEMDQALAAERADMRATADGNRREMAILSACVVVAILAIGYAVARVGRRQLLVPLGDLEKTIRRLAEGDRSVRAEPAGSTELRTVIEALNDLAAQTETLLAAEHARAARAGLRQAVAAQMQELDDPAHAARRITELVGVAVGAATVHCELAVPGRGEMRAGWPDGTPDLPTERTVTLISGKPCAPERGPDGTVWLTVGGDAECAPGYLHLSRPGTPDWTDAEQRLLTGVCREIERTLRQLSLQNDQARLITELRMLDQRKDVFIQTVTHELRTPLTSILGYTEMIADEDGTALSSMQQRALNAILRNAHRLHDTIGDLVLLDRPDNGAAVHAETLDLAAVAGMVRHELNNAARAKNLTVTFNADEGWVRGDRTQLQRALRKLMENAIKFTPSGGSVTCRMAADARTVAISVTDTGIGIPAEDVPGLFTPFHRAGNAMDQAVQGPGLGLAIVRDIVRDHGGTIAVQSVVGRGTTFTLTLPAAPAPAKSPAHV
ncbi:ATP-binding protein [Actinoplanes sp. G11-F43]|uniref:ATP-binding protein n=1 Tax=Actinoplanes sp. G11-F43 TaxID=3424130 RepID=UPI003D33BD66